MKINKEKFNQIADKIGNAIAITTATLFIVFSIFNVARALSEDKNFIAFMFIIIFCLSIKLYKAVKREAKEDSKSDKQD